MKTVKKSKGIPQAIFVIFAFLFIPILINWFGIVFPQSDEDYIPYNYEITGYHVEMVLHENNVLSIEENINVLHNENMHGIVRAIPKLQKVTFKQGDTSKSLNYLVDVDLKTSNKDVSFYEENGVYYFRLGNENLYVNGIEQYIFSYDINLKDDRIKEFDQFYYNILGNYWDTTISNFSFKLTLPNAINTDTVMNLYYGEYGSTSSVQIYPDSQGKIYEANIVYTFGVGEGLTARVLFDEGYFTIPNNYMFVNIVIIVCLLIALIVGFVLFKKFSNRKIIIPVVNFEVPNDMPPSEVGFVIDGRVDNKDISSLIVYWAQKGYLQIINKAEEDKKEDIYLKKQKDADDKMKNYEKKIFESMFSSDEEVSLSKVGEKIWPNIILAKSEITNQHEGKNFQLVNNIARGVLLFMSATALAGVTRILALRVAHIWSMLICIVLSFLWYGIGFALLKVKDDSYVKNQKTTKIILFCIAIAILVAYAFLTYDVYADNDFLTFIAIIVSGACLFMASQVNIRTDFGINLLGQILGFKQFIEFTEKDRIKMMVKENPEIFFEILPYAYVLGVSDEWIKQFDGIVINMPSWYLSSNDNTILNYMIFRNMFNSMMFSANASMITPKINAVKSASGGGFGGFGGGGGFTGGGFGGGGGRGW